jgi:hypothetical protein
VTGGGNNSNAYSCVGIGFGLTSDRQGWKEMISLCATDIRRNYRRKHSVRTMSSTGQYPVSNPKIIDVDNVILY